MRTEIQVIVWEKPEGPEAQVRRRTYSDDGTLVSRHYLTRDGEWEELKGNGEINVEWATQSVMLYKEDGSGVQDTEVAQIKPSEFMLTFEERMKVFREDVGLSLAECGKRFEEIAKELQRWCYDN